MAITDIDISETLEAGAPSIKYTGDMNPNMQMASASDAQQTEADRLWQIELKKMELDENYIPEIIDPEEMKVASDPSWEAEWDDAYENYKAKQIQLGQEFVSKEEFMMDYQNNMASGGRVKFGLGSIFKGIKKAVKSAVKSPVGKAALLGGLGMYGMGAGPWASGGMWGNARGAGFLRNIGPALFGTKAQHMPFENAFGQMVSKSIPGKEGFLSKFLPSSGIGQTALAGAVGLTAASAFEGMDEDEVKALRSNPDALRSYLKQYHTNTHPDKSPEEVDLWVEQNMYSTGGRVGLASGANEKFEEKIAALVAKGLTRELAEAIVLSDISPDNFQIIDALENKADGGRIGYSDRGVVSLEQGKESIWNKRENPERHYEMVEKPILDKLDYIYSLRPEAQVKLKDEIKALKLQLSGDAPQFAQGGRIGFAYGPDQTAEAAGIMGQLPVRKNGAGVKELDLRDSGGFIPPVGVKEKADDIPAMLSNNEFVMTADAVRAAGGGSVEKGAQVMYDQMKLLENKVA